MIMVFSNSLPLYVDPPNFQQQRDHHIQRLLIPPRGTSTLSTMRPGSMAERARMAKLPLPETGLKCPRCESTNTKFCYFNNYSLSQPRHFCKTCRRYWTRGGALRNVPVGGGCRRNNKRGKGVNVMSQSSSTRPSPVSIGGWPAGAGGSGCSTSGVSAFSTMTAATTRLPCPLPPQMPNFLLGSYIPGSAEAGSLLLGGLAGDPVLTAAGLSQPPLRLAAAMQQFPFLTGLEPAPPPPLFQSGVNQGLEDSAPGMKMDHQAESTHGGVNLSDNFLGIGHHDQRHQQQQQRHDHHRHGNDQYNWSTTAGSAWPDLV